MMKKIEFDKAAREKLLSGVEQLNKAVSSTLGAKGRNVIFQLGNTYGVTKDGATVASNIELEDPIENAGCKIVSEASARTARDAGDGTTTSTVLASIMIKLAMDAVDSGANPMSVKRGIDLAVTDLVRNVEDQKMDVDMESDDILNIASISSNGDHVIAKMISDIYKKVGATGVVRLEHTQMTETTSNVVEGCQFNSGMLSPNFATNSKGFAEYDDVLILITDKKFEAGVEEIVPALEIANQKQAPLLIVCGGMEGETLSTLVINKLKSKLPVVAVTAPEFGDKRMEILEDIAIITGGTVISEDLGTHIKTMTIDDMGTADKIIADREFLTVIGKHGDEMAIENRHEVIKNQLKEDMHMQETWRLNKRIATLTGGIGVIYVGGNSETEMKESYYRMEDALSATKAAIESGYVPGGGVVYLNARVAIERSDRVFGDRDFNTGYKIALKSMLKPMSTIIENCGVSFPEVYAELGERVTEAPIYATGLDKSIKHFNLMGYNAATDEIVNVVERGIIDPVKVAVTAIQNAASVAGMILTTNTVIYDERK
jgi:chaperonin GroEL